MELLLISILLLILENNRYTLTVSSSIHKITVSSYPRFHNNHIQVYSKATIHLGAFYNNILVSVMSLTKMTNKEWNLVRFASSIMYNVQGICSKFIKYFEKHYDFRIIKTFLDRRWEVNMDNNVYTKSGFIKDSILKPDYHYTNGHGKRLHKFGFRKQKLHKKYNLPLSMTETEMTDKIGYYRIWDCGLIKYVYVNQNSDE